MSLESRLFDAEKISAEIVKITNSLLDLQKAADSVGAALRSNLEATKTAKSMDDLSKSAKQFNDSQKQAADIAKQNADKLKELAEKADKLSEADKRAYIEIQKQRFELAAAKKDLDAMAKAELEAANANGVAADSYKALEKEMKATGLQIKMMSQAEINSANGKELIKKYNEINDQLKKIDKSMGNNQRLVGSYEEQIKSAATSINGMKEQLKDLTDKLNNMDVNSDEFKETKDTIDKLSLAVDQAAGKVDEFGNKEPKNIAKKNFEDTMVTVSILSSSIGALSTAFDDNEDVQKSLQKATQALAISQSVANVVKEKGAIIDTLILAKEKALTASKWVLNTVTKVFGLTSTQAWAAATLGVSLLIAGIIALIANFQAITDSVKAFFGVTNEFAETEKQINSLTNALKNYDDRTDRVADRLKAEGKSEQEILDFKKRRYEEELKLNQDRYNKLNSLNRDLTDEEKEMKKESVEFINNQNIVRYEFETEQININSKAKDKAADDDRKRAEDQQRLNEKIILGRRKLIDIELSLLTESRDKALKIRTEQYEREVQDLKRNGEYSIKLASALANQLRADRKAINLDWNKKDIQDEIKANDLIISNMEKQGQDTLKMRMYQLQKQRELEEKEGGDLNEIKLKYQLLAIAETAKNADDAAAKAVQAFSKVTGSIKTQSEKDIIELKKSLAKGAISQEDYEAKVAKITADAAKDANNAMIANLRTILDNTKLSEEKRAEYSDKLTELEIANENAAADAAIDANKKAVDSDKGAAAQRMKTAEAIASQGMEMIGAIAEFANQKSEQRIEELEAEKESNSANYESQQSELDNAIMSDETRAAKQKELDEKKASDELKIQQKIQAEKVKQAKWEKAQAIMSAVIGASLAIIKTSAELGFPLAIPFIAMTAATSAINVATILSQKVPAYEHGGLTQGEPVSLWGEKRQEVAVTPGGEVYTASVPTLSIFDKGTRIYSSVADFERQNSFSFDYDRMANKIPRASVSIDYDRISTIVGNNGKYRALKHRRYN